MAFTTCPECNKTISDKAKACPHCGYPLQDNNSAVAQDSEVKVEFIFGDILERYKRIREGEKALMSIFDIANLSINLFDARKNLPYEDYKKVNALFEGVKKAHSTQNSMDFQELSMLQSAIIVMFDHFVPYKEYSGESREFTEMKLSVVNGLKSEPYFMLIAQGLLTKTIDENPDLQWLIKDDEKPLLRGFI